VKRSNTYPIVTAAQPTYTNSMAVDEDGTDFSYFSVVKFGSSGKSLYMLIDTGSANTWVMSDTCTSTTCELHNTFGKTDSNTLNISTTQWSVVYGTGSVSGVVGQDTVAFAGFSISLSFGLASNVSDEFQGYPIDGILGLGRPQSSSLNAPTLMESLVNQKLIKSNLFAVNLQRNSDGSNDGVVTFGDWDKSKFNGSLSWIDSVSGSNLWEIPISDVAVDGNAGKFTGKTAIVDTGTSQILMPLPDASKLHSLFPNVKQNGENFQLPCSSTQKIQFILAGVTYVVPPKDYLGKSVDGEYCASNIIGRVSLTCAAMLQPFSCASCFYVGPKTDVLHLCSKLSA
jgi:cathepsin D